MFGSATSAVASRARNRDEFPSAKSKDQTALPDSERAVRSGRDRSGGRPIREQDGLSLAAAGADRNGPARWRTEKGRKCGGRPQPAKTEMMRSIVSQATIGARGTAFGSALWRMLRDIAAATEGRCPPRPVGEALRRPRTAHSRRSESPLAALRWTEERFPRCR